MSAETTHQSEEVTNLRADLVAEQHALDDVVANIDDDAWLTRTPSPGWSVADQIGHLAFFDASAATAIIDPAAFDQSLRDLIDGAASAGVDEYTLGDFRTKSPGDQLASWRRARRSLDDASASLADGTRVPWYGPSMGAKSFLSARLMETWAHGTDVVDALGASRPATDRLRHVAQLGFITRSWSYRVRGEEVPDGEVRLELTAPSGALWTWGREDADEVIEGSAEDFALVVTQRRHVDDTSLKTGKLGYHWMTRAQAFAGAKSDGPKPRST